MMLAALCCLLNFSAALEAYVATASFISFIFFTGLPNILVVAIIFFTMSSFSISLTGSPFNSFTKRIPTTPPKFLCAHSSVFLVRSKAVNTAFISISFSAYCLPTPHTSPIGVSCNALSTFSFVSSTTTHCVANLFFLAR